MKYNMPKHGICANKSRCYQDSYGESHHFLGPHGLRKHASRCWKDQSKRRNQYKRVPHFDLFERYEHDECGVIMTDVDVEQMCYLLNTYKCATI